MQSGARLQGRGARLDDGPWSELSRLDGGPHGLGAGSMPDRGARRARFRAVLSPFFTAQSQGGWVHWHAEISIKVL